jgi:hypothetical protein
MAMHKVIEFKANQTFEGMPHFAAKTKHRYWVKHEIMVNDEYE